MNKRPLLCVLAGFVLGEVWFYQFHETAAKAVFSFVAMMMIIICIRKKDSFFLFLFIGLLTGGIREIQWISWQNSFEHCLSIENCRIEGKIESEKITDSSHMVIVNELTINQKPYKGRIVVYLESDLNYYLGCTIKLNGMVESFQKPTNPGEFDYKKYQKGKGIWGCVYEPDITEVRYGSFLIKEEVSRFRKTTALYLKSNMDESQYGIATAMLLGEKGELKKSQKTLFEQGGISHVLAVSGLHMTLIGAGIYKLFRKIGFSYPICVVSSFPVILLYAMMTGMSSSCLRASVMLIVYLIAQWKGYIYDLPSSLALAGIWLLWEIPDRILDSGFLLSFGAMIGIGILSPFLQETFMQSMEKNRIKSNFFSGIVIMLCMLPLSFHFFYGVSVAGVFLNIIVIPMMSLLVPLLAFGGMGWLSFFPEFLSKICLFVASVLIGLFQFLCQKTEKIPFAYLQVGYRGKDFVLLYYFLLLLAVMGLCCVNRKRKKYVLLIWGITVFFFIYFTGRNDSFLVALDVGQGDGILFHSETGEVSMIDGGSSSKKKVGEYIIEPALKFYGITRVNYWFLTHMDEDHTSGVEELLERGYPIQYLILPDLKEQTEKQRELEKLAYQNHTKVIYMSRGSSLRLKKETIYCLHPKKGQAYDDANQGSLVLLLTVKNQEILLTGDVEKSGEEEMKQYWKTVESRFLGTKEKGNKERILKVAHHGSAYGTGIELLEAFAPNVAINSCGKNNVYGHPAKETVQRILDCGAVFYDTSMFGAIEVKCGEKAQFYSYGME